MMHKCDKWRELMLQETEEERVRGLLQQKVDEANLFDDGVEGIEDWEDTPDKKKTVVIHPKEYYIKQAKKRNKRNKAASKARKINRGKK